jgi:hypothetical protein
MPRPRVPIEDRQRAVRACIPCKTSKKRCDSQTPCSSCVRRNCEQVCLIEDGRQTLGHTARNLTSPSSRLSRQQRSEDGAQNHTRTKHPSTQIPVLSPALYEGLADPADSFSSPVERPGDEQVGSEVRADDHVAASPPREAALFPRSRLMLNANGEKSRLIREAMS